VLVDITKDAQFAEVDFAYPASVQLKSFRPTTHPHQKQIELAASMINNAKRPLVLAGQGIHIAKAQRELKAFIEKALFFVKAVWRGFRDAETEALILLLAIVLGIGTLFYNQIEHWNLLDSLYFTVITLTTVGYGDLAPKTDIGKMFTIGYVFAGLILILGFINSIVKQTIENKTLAQVVEEEQFYKELRKFKRK